MILNMTNPELELSTSVLSLLLRIQRVELGVTFHNKLHFMVQGKDDHSGVMLVRRNENDYRLCCTWAFIIMP